MTKDQAIEIIKEEIDFHKRMEDDGDKLDWEHCIKHNLHDPRDCAKRHHRVRRAFEIALNALDN